MRVNHLGRFNSWDGLRTVERQDRDPEHHTHIHFGMKNPDTDQFKRWHETDGDDDEEGEGGNRAELDALKENVAALAQAVSKIIAILESASGKGEGEEEEDDDEEEEREAADDDEEEEEEHRHDAGATSFAGRAGAKRLEEEHERRVAHDNSRILGGGIRLQGDGISLHDGYDHSSRISRLNDAHAIHYGAAKKVEREAITGRLLDQVGDPGLEHCDRLEQLQRLNNQFYRRGRK